MFNACGDDTDNGNGGNKNTSNEVVVSENISIGSKKNDGLILQMVSPAEKSKYNLINLCQNIY